MTKHIIFDLGNVLITWEPDRVYLPYFQDQNKVQAFYEETKILEVNLELDKGLPFDIGLKKLADEFPHYKDAIFLWKFEWAAMIGGLDHATVEILKDLYQANYPIYAITNWSAETFPYVYYKYDFFKLFTDIVVSGREKLLKPDPEIYELFLKRNNLIAEDCLFIDDNLSNVHGANKVGISAIHFKSASQLLTELKKLNIL